MSAEAYGNWWVWRCPHHVRTHEPPAVRHSRQCDGAARRRSFGEILIEHRTTIGDVSLERLDDFIGQGHDTVFAAFRIAYKNRLVLEIDVFYA